ncbi:hypothetical protein NL676_023253 [Syzygium grande]|nr:hypothetical protein NL676_023253 [Syzygium grande]
MVLAFRALLRGNCSGYTAFGGFIRVDLWRDELGTVLDQRNLTLLVYYIGSQVGAGRRRYGGVVAMLGGYALAYFALLCGAFAWGTDSASPASRRRPKVLGAHLEFLAGALDGKVWLGWDSATWRACVSRFVGFRWCPVPLNGC